MTFWQMPGGAAERLALALAIGFLVGVERGWQSRGLAEGGRTAGIRTYALSGLLGGIAGLLTPAFGGWAIAALGLPFAAAFITFKSQEQADEGDHSVTAVVAALVVFALGAYATVGSWRVAAGAGVVTAALLAFKRVLHGWLQRLTWEELRSALILLSMSFVVLPILPDRGFGPYRALNPHELWMLTIALAGVSFAAYVAIRVFGSQKGLIVGAVAGALVSSTAVTLNIGRLVRGGEAQARLASAAALLAGAVMAVRIGVIGGVLSPPLLLRLAPPLAAFAAVSTALAGLVIWRDSRRDGAASMPPMTSPFELAAILKLGLVLGAVFAAARILGGVYGPQGLLPLAAFAGLVDVDAVTLAVARMAGAEQLDLGFGVGAILLAAGVDSLSKSVIAFVVGGVRFGGWFLAGTAIAAAAAALAWVAG